MSYEFQKFWLKITAFVVGSFGPIFFLGTMISIMEPARFTLILCSTFFVAMVDGIGGKRKTQGKAIWCLA
ncbi:MAG: hypothetical protein AAF518_24910 [Spirochaetota bacterium]